VIVNNIGSRNDTIQVYWLCDSIQVVCGCFKGSLLSFEKAVDQTHGGNEHGQRYRQLINQVWAMMSV
jgi:hypothetical protein